MGPDLLIEAWKVGGLVAVLICLLALIVWAIWKDARARERRMSGAIEKCQESHATASGTLATLVANNTNAFRENTEATRALCDVMRDRPCLKDPTPTRPHPQIPDHRPPPDHRH